jgi:4-amino-4-deoxychorismate lyase
MAGGALAMSTLINGAPGDTVSVDERALHYGDGLFETMRCRDGQVRWLDLHLARLACGCERLGIAMPDRDQLQRELAQLAQGQQRCLLKLIVSRGVATARGYRPSGTEQPTRILRRYDWQPAPAGEYRVHHSPVRLGRNAALSGIKHLNRLEQVLAQQAAARAGVDEALQSTESGELIAGSMSNVFLVDGNRWLTPPIVDCGVAGITRGRVLAHASALGIEVREQPLKCADALATPAIVLSNVRLGLQAVHWYEGRRLSVPASVTRLWEAIDGAAN